MEKKRGRPCVDDSKKFQYRLRLDEGDNSLLEYLSMQTGLSKADVLRKGLELMDKIHKYK